MSIAMKRISDTIRNWKLTTILSAIGNCNGKIYTELKELCHFIQMKYQKLLKKMDATNANRGGKEDELILKQDR